MIPDDILTEILASQVGGLSLGCRTPAQEWGEVDWVEVWAAWVGSQLRPGWEEAGGEREHR